MGIYKPLRRGCDGTNLWRDKSAAYFLPYFTGLSHFAHLVLVYSYLLSTLFSLFRLFFSRSKGQQVCFSFCCVEGAASHFFFLSPWNSFVNFQARYKKEQFMRIPFDSTHVVIYSFFSFTVMMEFPVGQDGPHGDFRLVNRRTSNS